MIASLSSPPASHSPSLLLHSPQGPREHLHLEPARMEMMSWGTEILQHPTPDSNWFLEFPPHQQQLPGGVSRSWTAEENKVFEQALAIHDGDTPERWLRVAEITGKSVEDVKRHYSDLEQDVQQIESGLVPIPGYSSPAFTLDWAGSGSGSGSGSSHGGGGGRHPYGGGSGGGCGGGRRPGPGGGRGSDHERKKGVPWTEEEHRLFLLGLKKYGKGDWRSISRNYVQSRTPTQVASHAQKYFIRLSSGGKDKRRSSIHDITTVNVPDENSCTGTTTAASQQQQQAQQQLMSTPPPVGCTAAVTAAAQPEPPSLPPPQAPHVASAAAAVVEQFSTAAADAARISEAALVDAMVSQARNNGSHLLAAASQYRHKLAGIRESLAVSPHNLRFQMQSAPPHRVT